MSYLAQPTSTSDYGVVKVGNYIVVADGVISLAQDVSPTADVTFNKLTATTDIGASGNILALGDVSGAKIFDNGNRVVTSVTPTAGSGISITGLTSGGPGSTFSVANTGVLSLTAGSGISLTAGTGNITISSFGADLINVIGVTTNYTATLSDEYIGVKSASAVTITLPAGVDGRVYTIKDEFGQGSGKITLQPQAGSKVDNSNTYVISVPYQSVQIVFRSGNWWIM